MKIKFTFRNACHFICTNSVSILLVLGLVFFNSCNSEEEMGPKPTASFTHSADELVVTFTNTSTDAARFEWDFGVDGADDAVSTEKDPVFTFPETGTYNVRLRVWNAQEDATDQSIEEISVEKIIPPDEPIAAFTINTEELKLTLENTSQHATSYEWDFGDGSATSADENPTHNYAESGRYLLSLTATGPGGVNLFTDSVFVDTLAILNGTWDDHESKDDNRTEWRNKPLEKDADIVYGSSDFFAKATSSNNHTPGGSYSGNLTTNVTSSKPQRWLYQSIIVSTNTDYTIKFWIKQASGANCESTAQIYNEPFELIAGRDVAENILAEKKYGAEDAIDDWKEVSIDFNSGSNMEVLLFIFNDFENATKDSYFDDFVIEVK